MHLKHILAIAGLTLATVASAAPQSSHAYGLVDVGSSNLSNWDESGSGHAGVGVTFGAKVTRSLALETSYKNFGNRDGAKPEAFTFALVGDYPLNRAFSLVGKGGLAHTSVSVDAQYNGIRAGFSKTGLVLAGGFDYRFSRDWSVRTLIEAYPDYAGTDETMTNVSVGLKYNF